MSEYSYHVLRTKASNDSEFKKKDTTIIKIYLGFSPMNYPWEPCLVENVRNTLVLMGVSETVKMSRVIKVCNVCLMVGHDLALEWWWKKMDPG